MAIYEVEGPDGSTYEIEAPDGATEDQVLQFAKSQFVPRNSSGGPLTRNSPRRQPTPPAPPVNPQLAMSQAVLNQNEAVAARAADVASGVATGIKSTPAATRQMTGGFAAQTGQHGADVVADEGLQYAAAGNEREFRNKMGLAAGMRRAAREGQAQYEQSSAELADLSNPYAGGLEKAFEQGIPSAAQSLAVAIPATLATGNPLVGALATAGTLGAGAGGSRFAQLKSLGFSDDIAQESALYAQGLETLTEFLPGETLLKSATGFWKKAGEFLAQDIVGENVTSIGSMVDDMRVGLRDDITKQDLMDAVAETTAATIAGGGVQLGSVQIMQKAISLANRKAEQRSPLQPIAPAELPEAASAARDEAIAKGMAMADSFAGKKPAGQTFTPPDSLVAKAGITPITVSGVSASGPVAADAPTDDLAGDYPTPVATDAELLDKVATTAPTAATAPQAAPAQAWYGRRGDGYVTEMDAQQALPGRQRMFRDLDWKVEPAEGGKYRIAGYPRGQAPTSDGRTAQPVAAAPAADSAAPAPAEPTWQKFDGDTLGVPRAEMPQIKAEHRGAMVNFLNARGIPHAQQTVDPNTLKPTQAEFSPEKVQKALDFEGGNRSILVSSDSRVLDGHHQWLAAKEKGEPVNVIRLQSPIRHLLNQARAFPSSTLSQETTNVTTPEQTAAPVNEQPATVVPRTALALSQTERSGLNLAIPAPKPVQAAAFTALEKNFGVSAVEDQSSMLRDDGHLIASSIARALGNTYTVIRTAGKDAGEIGGFVNRVGGKHIFVAAGVRHAPLTIAMHEGLHALPDNIRVKLEKDLLDLFDLKKIEDFQKDFAYPLDKLDTEIPAKIAEAISTRKDFWEQLHTRLGNHDFKSVAKIILAKLNEIIDKMTARSGQKFVDKYLGDNVIQARDLLADAYAKAMKNERADSPEGQTELAQSFVRRHPHLDTPEFKKWFSGSKVVKKNGDPILVYHGTGHDFEEFRPSKSAYYGKGGIYFTDSLDAGKHFAGEFDDGHVLRVYLSIKNPYYDNGERDVTVKQLEREGYDGIIAETDVAGGDTMYVAFRPEQIKHENNLGAYSEDSPNIFLARQQRAGREIPEGTADVANIDAAFKLAREGSFPTNRDFKVAIQKLVLDAAGKADLSEFSKSTEKHLIGLATSEASTAIKSNSNAVGWYDGTVSKALATLSLVHPEIATDHRAKFAFIWSLAVTSNGLKVDKNFELAEKAYSLFKKSGRMPGNVGIGTAAAAINRSLELYNTLVDKYGVDEVENFMTTYQKAGDIEAFTGVPVSGENLSTMVYGAAALGPKIGNGFFMNLYGKFDQLTIDRWLMRTWGRWTGTLIETNPKQVAAKRAAMRDLIRGLSPADKKAFEAIIGVKLTIGDPDAAALAIQKSSVKPEKRAAMKTVSSGDDLRKVGNALTKYLDGQVEAPSGAPQRRDIRKVCGAALAELQKEYPALTMADLQALLWYPEKRLYDAAKTAGEANDGYEDDEAPDYANAAAKLARSKGIDDDAIRGAASGSRVSPAVGAGRAQPGRAGESAAPALSLQERSDAAGSGRDRGLGQEDLPEYGRRRIGAASVVGYHYSRDEQTVLDGSKYGTGMRGAEAQRVAASTDPRIKQRVYFYASKGKGISPEVGVGHNRHEVRLNNIYAAAGDPLNLKKTADFNDFESAVIDAGYDGYMVPFGDQNAVVLLGDHKVPVKHTGYGSVREYVNADAPALSRQDINELGFYSELVRQLERGPNVAPKDQWKAYIKGLAQKGVKADEIEWSGVNEWLDLQTGKVPKDAVVGYVDGNGVEIVETKLGGTRSADAKRALTARGYMISGFDDGTPSIYDPEGNLVNEAGVISDDVPPEDYDLVSAVNGTEFMGESRYSTYQLPGGTNYREILLRLPTAARPLGTFSHPAHWEQTNVLAHLRVNDRFDANGKRVLFVEEIQSDWAQKGKKSGFSMTAAERAAAQAAEDKRHADAVSKRTKEIDEELKDVRRQLRSLTGPATDFASTLKKMEEDLYQEWRSLENSRPQNIRTKFDGVPRAPYVTKTDAWVALALKRAISMAVQEGYDSVAFINGRQSAERYDLSKQLSRIVFRDNSSHGIADARMEDIEYSPEYAASLPAGSLDGHLEAFDKSGKEVISQFVRSESQLADLVGKEAAAKLLQAPKKRVRSGGIGFRQRELNGLELQVGGEGMKTFYDVIVPKVVKDLAKKLGGEQKQLQITGVSNWDIAAVADERDPGLFRIRDNKHGKWLRSITHDGDSSWTGDMVRAAKYSRSGALGTVNQILDDESASETLTQPGLVITPSMRAKVADEGLPAFSLMPREDSKKQTSTPAFKAWFGDSKVVDEQGEPLVVYHGSESTGIRVFRGAEGAGWFAQDHERAQDYGSKAMYSAYLSLQNPAILDGKDSGTWKQAIAFNESDPYAWYKKNGFDGIRTSEGGGSWLAFYPNQIKSAIGNDGSFDPYNPDIAFSRQQLTPAASGPARFIIPSETSAEQFRRTIQDAQLRLKRIQDMVAEQGGMVDEPRNAYQAWELMPGRVESVVQRFDDKYVTPFIDSLATHKVTPDEIALYAYAMHAPERNADIKRRNPGGVGIAGIIDARIANAGSGMTDADAARVLAAVKKEGRQAAFDAVYKEFRKLIDANRRAMFGYGLITPQEFAALPMKYKNWIPLRGLEHVDHEQDEFAPRRGRGLDIRGAEFMPAMGRISRASAIIENVLTDFYSTATRGERNIVNRVLLDLALANPDSTLWEIDPKTHVREENKSSGLIEGYMKPETRTDVIALKVAGKPVYIRIKDPLLRRALLDEWRTQMKGLPIKVMAAVNTLLRNTLTRYNPPFAAANAARDTQQAMSYIIGELGSKAGLKFAATWPKALAAAGRQEFGTPGRAGLFGDPAMDRSYEEFLKSGSITGGFYMKDVEDITRDIHRRLVKAGGARNIHGFKDAVSLAAHTKLLFGVATPAQLLKLVEAAGILTENATRFALFHAARQMGATRTTAASIAKNGTTNFNRKGEWGPMLGSLYLFANASIQGVRGGLHSIVKSKHRAQVAALMATWVGMGTAFALWGATAGGEDDNGEAYWDMISSEEKRRNWIIMLPPGEAMFEGATRVGARGRYVKFPMPYLFNLFPVIGSGIADAIRHAGDSTRGQSAPQVLAEVAGTAIDSMNPIGGAVDVTNRDALLLAAAPTIADIPLQFILDVGPFGTPTSPTYQNLKVPDHESVTANQAGGWGHSTSRWLYNVTDPVAKKIGSGEFFDGRGISLKPGTIENSVYTLTGGTGRFVGDILSTTLHLADDQNPLTPNSVPFLNKLYSEVGESQTARKAYDRANKAMDFDAQRKKEEGIDYEPRSKYEQAMIDVAGAAEDFQSTMSKIRKEQIRVMSDATISKKDRIAQAVELKVGMDEAARSFNGTYVDIMREYEASE